MNLHQDFRIVKQVLMEKRWMFNVLFYHKVKKKSIRLNCQAVN